MNKTIKKKKNPKNKTQKKRVQRGGNNQTEIDKIRPLIIKYINHNTDDSRVETKRLENIKELKRKIGMIEEMIKTQTDTTTRHLKDTKVFTQLDINNDDVQKKDFLTKRDALITELRAFQRYDQTRNMAKNEIKRIIDTVRLKLSNATKAQLGVLEDYEKIFSLVLQTKDYVIIDFIKNQLNDPNNMKTPNKIKDTLKTIEDEISRSKMDDELGPDKSSTEEQPANNFGEELNTTNKVKEKSPTLDDGLGPDEELSPPDKIFKELRKDALKNKGRNDEKVDRNFIGNNEFNNTTKNEAAELIQTNVRKMQAIKAARIKAEQKETARKEAEAKEAADKRAAEEKARKEAEAKEAADKRAAEEKARIKAEQKTARKEAEAKEAADKRTAEEKARIKAEAKEAANKRAAEETARKEAEAKEAEQKAARIKAIADAEDEAVRLKAIADAKEAANKRAAEETARKEAEAKEAADKKAAEEKQKQEKLDLKAIADADEAARLKAIADAEDEAARLKAIADAEDEAARLKAIADADEAAKIKAQSEQEAAATKIQQMIKAQQKQNNVAAGLSTLSITNPVVTNPVVTTKPVVTKPVPQKVLSIKILSDNGLLPPIQYAKLIGLSNEIKVLFSNRTFVYNLLLTRTLGSYGSRWLQIANYLYKDDPNNPTKYELIDLTNPIIKKSFCYDPNDDTDLDDLLTKNENIDATKWFKNPIKVRVHELSPIATSPNNNSVEYTHYKRIR